VIGPLFPGWKGKGRPVADRRPVVEGRHGITSNWARNRLTTRSDAPAAG
jgi:hypothetical protein